MVINNVTLEDHRYVVVTHPPDDECSHHRTEQHPQSFKQKDSFIHPQEHVTKIGTEVL